MRLVEILSSAGLRELYPPQAMALEAGLLSERSSLVVAAPTASGKTLVAEMAAIEAFLKGEGKALYLVPLRALAREKHEEFSGKYGKCGMRVAQSTGDYDSADPWLAGADLIISTNEKLDSLIRHRAAWLGEVCLVVADEIHLLGDPHRGPNLEMVLTRLRWMNPKLRILALSATIPNAAEIAGWLDARLVESDWRPVPLREGVYFHDAVMFNDGTVRWVVRESPHEAVNLALETIREGGQALVFVNTRKGSESVARNAGKDVARLIPEEKRKELDALSGHVLGASAEPTRLCRRLAECTGHGVAFHHAGINPSQRRLIEDAFKANRIKLIAATTTLAMGLNLPSRRVIIRDWWRFESGFGLQPIAVMEIKQMAGRAGRPGLDDYGEAVLIARDRQDERHLFNTYIKGKPENVISRLADESALRTHILASIAGGFATTREVLSDFLGSTFFARQKGTVRLASITDRVVDFLIAEEMVFSDGTRIAATRFGMRVAELYIDPLTAVVMKNALHLAKGREAFPFLHMITRTPDMMVLPLKRRDMEEMFAVFHRESEGLLIPEGDKHADDEFLAELKTATLLLDWIEERPEDGIVDRFDVGPGDVHNVVRLADWLLYSAGQVAKVFGLKEAEKALSPLRTRVVYGVREELLPLVTLSGIGRVRARSLYNAGYRGVRDIREATVEELARVPAIGKVIAEDIKRQVITEVGKKGDKTV